VDLHLILLIVTSFIAGLIDSIAGGGGLLTVPALSIVMGPGVHAIATNKVAATVASLVAMLVYFKNGHVSFRAYLSFAVVVALGAFVGSRLGPLLTPQTYKNILLLVCPVMLWVVFKRELWIREPRVDLRSTTSGLSLLTAFACGLYDGIAGPGGGTLMFLSLYLLVGLPLPLALGTSKLANLSSASLSFVSYAHQGLIDFRLGGIMAAGIAAGALIGAEIGSRRSAPAARVALAIISALLLFRLLFLPAT